MGLLSDYKKQQEEQRRKNPDRLPTQGQLGLRILVGGYLYYLIYQLYQGGVLEYSGWKLAVMLFGMILFAAFGGYFIYNGVRAMLRHEYLDMNAIPPAPEEDDDGKQDGEISERSSEEEQKPENKP